ncbi:MAG: hypothetical protein RIT43_1018, partial [Bacteroidota bacterium]
YALVGTMALVIFSTFLSTTLIKHKFSPRLESVLHIIGWINSAMLLLSVFYPFILKNLWNFNFGIAFIFPSIFFLSKVIHATSKLEKVLFYLTILNILMIETGLIFRLSEAWFYDLVTACLLLLTLVILTNLVFYYVKKNQ